MIPGRSYEFDLESFCLEPGEPQPELRSELHLEKSNTISKSWVSEILENYKDKGLSQEQAQILIWSLTSGVTYSEFSIENRKNLDRLFKNASSRFSRSIFDKKIRDVIDGHLPEQVVEAKERFAEFRKILQDSNRKYQDIERELAPKVLNEMPEPAGWFKTSEGYYVSLTSNGYKETNVRIYWEKIGEKNFSMHMKIIQKILRMKRGWIFTTMLKELSMQKNIKVMILKEMLSTLAWRRLELVTLYG